MQDVTPADIAWLKNAKDASTGSCGDGSFESKGRRAHNERVDRLVAAAERSVTVAASRDTFITDVKAVLRAAGPDYDMAAELVANLALRAGAFASQPKADANANAFVCKRRDANGSCPLHNLHCQYPACEQRV